MKNLIKTINYLEKLVAENKATDKDKKYLEVLKKHLIIIS